MSIDHLHQPRPPRAQRPRHTPWWHTAIGAIVLFGSAPTASAQSGYQLQYSYGDVRVTPQGRPEQRISQPRPLNQRDIIRLSGRRSFIWVTCPNPTRSIKFADIDQPRSVDSICAPGPRPRRTGPRGSIDDLWAIAQGEFIPQTYLAPHRSTVAWPAVADAQYYRLQLRDRDTQAIAWSAETDGPIASMPYGGSELTGRVYALSVEAIDTAGRILDRYDLHRIVPLPEAAAISLADDWNAIATDRAIDDLARRLLRFDRAASVSTPDDDAPELWWDAISALQSGPTASDPAALLRLATAYLHLNRAPEAQTLAQQALSATAPDAPLDRAAALVALAQAQMLADDCTATTTLTAARSIYQALNAPEDVEALDFAIERFRDRCPLSQP